jgi:carboxymethylenebutenolidase
MVAADPKRMSAVCSDPDSKPPIEPGSVRGDPGRHIDLFTAHGDHVAAFRADAMSPTGTGIIVLPDYYGLTPFYKELALRFAEIGVDAVAIDYYGRTAEPPPRDASFDHVAHAQRTTWAGLRADAAAAAAELRTAGHVDTLLSIGFCFGGRTSFLLGTVPELALSGVIGFYGWPVGNLANDTPAPADVADQLRVPLLGIFGGADPKIAAEDVRTFERSLTEAAAEYRIISYQGAPHSFFDRRQAAHIGAATEAWREVRDFIESRG